MNIYELEKKATPGPCKVGKYEPDPHLQVLTRGWMQGGRCIVDFINPDDAVLFAHCRNHFMEALEALKELANRPDCEGPLCHYCDTGLPHPKIGGEETLKLIAELEDVK